MIAYLGKFNTKDNYFMRVFFYGAVVSVPITKEEYDNIELELFDKLNLSDFNILCYNSGYDCVVRLTLNRKGA